MSNYKKDKSYIKQRLEYVSPVDYISELEEKIEYLEYLKNENERLNNKLEKIKEIINYYAVENEDYSKIYNDEEKELLEVVEGDK